MELHLILILVLMKVSNPEESGIIALVSVFVDKSYEAVLNILSEIIEIINFSEFIFTYKSSIFSSSK